MTTKIIQGEFMSAFQIGPNRARLSLLAGSSLAAASLALAVGGGVALAPTTARAANECAPVGVDPSANGGSADSYDCPNTTSYAGTGITYSSAGALTVASSGGAINVGAVGINLVGNASDSVTLNTTAGTVTGTGGPIIEVSSGSGDIDVTVAAVTGTATGVTHGISASSTGGGDISITNTAGNVNINSNAGTAQQVAAIRAVTSGGNGSIAITTNGNVTGRQNAISAQTSGSGALTITANGALNINATVGQATIDATTGTGLLTINIADVGTTTVNGQSGSAIRTNAGGDAVINIAGQRTVTASSATPGTLNLSAVGLTTVNNTGSISATSSGVAARVSGSSVEFNNDGFLTGRVDFSAVLGDATLNNNNTWKTQGVTVFGGGNTVVNNAGLLIVDENATATIQGLDKFVHTGGIRFGGDFVSPGPSVLSLPGVEFEAAGAAVLLMDATLGVEGQENCSTLTVADCLDISGGSTSGVTRVAINALNDPENILNVGGIVLVDVGDGETHAGDFVLDIGSTNYNADSKYGGVITTPGMLAYALVFDGDTQTHRLVSVVPSNRLEYVAGVQHVLSAWHLTSDTVAGRQADLRSGTKQGAWFRAAAEHTSRDIVMPFTVQGGEMVYEDAWSANAGTYIAGFDLLSNETVNGDFIFGVHAGYVSSELERDFSSAADTLEGATGGLYGSWWVGGLTFDATLNANFLKLTHERPAAEASDTNVISVGGRAEVGWRMSAGPGFYVQPLAVVSYVNADIKEVVQRTFSATYEDVSSLRGALGVRVGGETTTGSAATLGYWAVARAWNEFNDEGAVRIATSVEEVLFVDDLSGQFQELGAGLSLGNEGGTLEAFLSAGAKFQDEIDENYSASIGLRMRW